MALMDPQDGESIYRFPLEIPLTEIELPAAAKILSLQTKDNEPSIWIQLNPDHPKSKTLNVGIAVTGRGVPLGEFIATFQLEDSDGSTFVGHAFAIWS